MGKDHIFACDFLKPAHFLDQEITVMDDGFQLQFSDLLAGITRTGLAEDQFVQAGVKDLKAGLKLGDYLLREILRIIRYGIKQGGVALQLVDDERVIQLFQYFFQQVTDDRLSMLLVGAR